MSHIFLSNLIKIKFNDTDTAFDIHKSDHLIATAVLNMGQVFSRCVWIFLDKSLIRSHMPHI